MNYPLDQYISAIQQLRGESTIYQKLPMGVCKSPDIFQENIFQLFEGCDMVCVYIDNVLIITKDEFTYNLKALEKYLHKFVVAALKLNAEKSFLRCTENVYLSLWVIKNWVRPLPSKLDNIK